MVISLITAGWIIGTSAIYEYAATAMAPTYFDFKIWDTSREVGPSAAPIIPMEAASLISKPINAANDIAKNIPNCAAAPNKNNLGLEMCIRDRILSENLI